MRTTIEVHDDTAKIVWRCVRDVGGRHAHHPQDGRPDDARAPRSGTGLFGIANTISCGGTMIRLRAAEPIGDVASGMSTTWIEVPLAAGSHWGPDHRTALTDVLTRFAEPPDDELFIIAPFRVVVDVLGGSRRASIAVAGRPARVTTSGERGAWSTSERCTRSRVARPTPSCCC